MDKEQFSPNSQFENDNLQHDFVAAARAARNQEERKGRELTEQEERKMQDGFALDEMTKSVGWSIVQDILQNMPKAHVDPRGMSEVDWKFAELNAFWQGEVASELLQSLYGVIQEAHQLQRIKLGEVQETQRMRV
jgi:hypothetical protein